MKNKQIVGKMLEYTEKILKYTKGLSYEDFVCDTMLVEACVFNLEQIGEIANKVTEDFEVKHTSIPWRAIYGLRNRIVHNYEGVNFVLIWDIISEDLPKLSVSLAGLLKQI